MKGWRARPAGFDSRVGTRGHKGAGAGTSPPSQVGQALGDPPDPSGGKAEPGGAVAWRDHCAGAARARQGQARRRGRRGAGNSGVARVWRSRRAACIFKGSRDRPLRPAQVSVTSRRAAHPAAGSAGSSTTAVTRPRWINPRHARCSSGGISMVRRNGSVSWAACCCRAAATRPPQEFPLARGQGGFTAPLGLSQGLRSVSIGCGRSVEIIKLTLILRFHGGTVPAAVPGFHGQVIGEQPQLGGEGIRGGGHGVSRKRRCSQGSKQEAGMGVGMKNPRRKLSAGSWEASGRGRTCGLAGRESVQPKPTCDTGPRWSSLPQLLRFPRAP